MSTTEFDFSAIFEPLSEDQPTGTDPRLDSSPLSQFRQVRDAREEARRLERQADLDGEEPLQAVPHWRIVREKGLEVLQEQAKDLEVAAYVIEALLRLEGFAGLAQGCRLVRGLVESFWGELYPEPDEDGLETTLLPLARMNGDVLTDAINRVPVTQGQSLGPFKIWQYRQAQELEQYTPEEQEERVSRGAVTMSMMTRAKAETDPAYFRQVYEELKEAQQELSSLTAALDERAGHDSPNFSRVYECLEDALTTMRLLAGEHLAEPEEEAADGAGAGADGSGGGLPGERVDNALRSREDAFRILLRVAEFFERTEPQSLLPSEIRKVVRRGRMAPHELYRDLITDESVLDQLFKDVGMRREGSDGEGEEY